MDILSGAQNIVKKISITAVNARTVSIFLLRNNQDDKEGTRWLMSISNVGGARTTGWGSA